MNTNDNLMICSNCKQYVPYGSAYCGHCGSMFIYPNQQYYSPMYQQFPINYTKEKRHDSALSAVSGIISLIGFLFYGWLVILGFVLAIIDLIVTSVTKDNHYHYCSWFSIIVFVIVIIYALLYL